MGKANKAKKWEETYNKYKDGSMDSKLKELREKVENKSATKEEYYEFKEITKISENISKVTNVLELRSKLEKESKKVKDEIARRESLSGINKEIKDLEDELANLKDVEAKLKPLLKQNTSEESKEKINKQLAEISEKLSINNEKFVNAQKTLAENGRINTEISKIPTEDLKKQSFNIDTKISKCNMVANNLMKGLSWDAINIKLDNWKKRYTNKEKTVTKVKPEKIEYEDRKENNPVMDGIIEEEITDETEEKQMIEVSEFAKKHPRLAKLGAFIAKINPLSKVNREKRAQKKQEQENELKEKEDEVKEAIEDENFKEYIREVAEKGLKGIAEEKRTKFKEQAYARETQKFGEEYAKKSYSKSEKDDEER